MKRTVCFLLLISLALCLCACVKQDEQLHDPVRFYYPRVKPTYGKSDSVIAWEDREAEGFTENYLYLLRQYLKGPESDALARTFPRSVVMKDIKISGSTAYVLLNEHAASLTGLDLTMACACLTATVTELTGVQRVTVRAEGALLDGNSSITMDRDHILLLDESASNDTD